MKSIILAIILAESSFNPRAISPMGAVGLTQMMPIAVAQVQIEHNINRHTPNLFNPEVSKWYGQKYYEYCFDQTLNVKEALMCYNGGWRQVVRHRKGLKLAKETRLYVKKVLFFYDLFKRGREI